MASIPLIAVVDDDVSACAAMVDLARAMGFRAEGFHSATDFIASGTIGTTRGMITDLRMPGMSGLELHLRLVAMGAKLLTVLVTAYPDEATELHAKRIGIDGFLAKPCDPEVLFACLAPLRDA
jgi:FixJ family two-component response regulator